MSETFKKWLADLFPTLNNIQSVYRNTKTDDRWKYRLAKIDWQVYELIRALEYAIEESDAILKAEANLADRGDM